MAWTIGILPPREPELLNSFLLSLGKALGLASAFEAKCVGINGTVQFVDSYSHEHNIDEIFAQIESTQPKTNLHNCIVYIGNKFRITTEQLEMLQAARSARNFIAHDAGAIGCLSGMGAKSILQLYINLWPAVRALALGDNLISAWDYEICENEPAPLAIQEIYVGLVLDWVFEGSPVAPRTGILQAF